MNTACEVPLIEKLRSIEKTYQTSRECQWAEDGAATGHQFIPVGYMMHEAADRIQQQETELATLRNREGELERWNSEAKITLDHLSGVLQKLKVPSRVDWKEWISGLLTLKGIDSVTSSEPEAYLLHYREVSMAGQPRSCTKASLEPTVPDYYGDDEVKERVLISAKPLYLASPQVPSDTKDAERYRYLRASYMSHGVLSVARYDQIPSGVKRYLSLSLDDEIDKHIAASPKEGV